MSVDELQRAIKAYMDEPPRMVRVLDVRGYIREVDAGKIMPIHPDKILDVLNDARLRATVVYPLEE